MFSTPPTSAASSPRATFWHDLRGGLEGQTLGGPRAFSKADRSAFAQAIETALRKL
jgi:uncharacterized protein YaiI (UPF0178 family)